MRVETPEINGRKRIILSDYEEDYEDLQSQLGSILDSDSSENVLEKEMEEYQKADRDLILNMQDPSNIGPVEYVVFLNYAIANIYKIIRTEIKIKPPTDSTIKEMAKDALSLAIATNDLEVAIAKKSTFKTHLGWKAKQVVTDFAREYKKAMRNELNIGDGEMASHLEEKLMVSDHEGNVDTKTDVEMPEYHSNHRQAMEQSKKIEFAMRQVRFELSRESNFILDVSIGEILKSDGDPFTIPEWASYTDRNPEELRRLARGAKKL